MNKEQKRNKVGMEAVYFVGGLLLLFWGFFFGYTGVSAMGVGVGEVYYGGLTLSLLLEFVGFETICFLLSWLCLRNGFKAMDK